MIIDVACGPEHTVAMTPDGRVFTWGFGGYGRLGHNTNENEMVPRLLMHMKPSNVHTGGACAIFAGGSSCFVESRTQKQMFFWGQLKASGEATMYPKRYEDISSVAPEVFDVGMKHVLVSDGTNTFSMVCAPPPTPSVVGSHIARPLSPTPTRVSPWSFFRVLACALASQNRGFWLTVSNYASLLCRARSRTMQHLAIHIWSTIWPSRERRRATASWATARASPGGRAPYSSPPDRLTGSRSSASPVAL